MSSSESDLEFLGFEAVNLGSTSRTTVDNDNQSDISVSSVDTSDLSDFSDVEHPVDTPPIDRIGNAKKRRSLCVISRRLLDLRRH